MVETGFHIEEHDLAFNGKDLPQQPNEPDFFVEEHEMTLEEVKAMLERFECKYGMSSEEFSEKWKTSEVYWVAESVVWRGLIDSYKALNGKDDSHS
jgi:hypothetical protein